MTRRLIEAIALALVLIFAIFSGFAEREATAGCKKVWDAPLRRIFTEPVPCSPTEPVEPE